MLHYWTASQTHNAAHLAGSLASNVVTVLKSCIFSHSRYNQPFANVPRYHLSETILVDSATAITGGNFPLSSTSLIEHFFSKLPSTVPCWFSCWCSPWPSYNHLPKGTHEEGTANYPLLFFQRSIKHPRQLRSHGNVQRRCFLLRGAVKWLWSTSSFHEIPPPCWSKVYQRGDRSTLLARGRDIGQSQSNGNFPQGKAKPQAKVTAVHGHPNYGPCLKKAKQRSWFLERARCNPSFPKPNIQGHDPYRNPGQGLELLSILQLLPRQRYRAPFCCHSSREVPVVNRNFTADLRNWVMALLLSAFAISVELFCSLLAPDICCVTLSTSEAMSSAAGSAAPPKTCVLSVLVKPFSNADFFVNVCPGRRYQILLAYK